MIYSVLGCGIMILDDSQNKNSQKASAIKLSALQKEKFMKWLSHDIID